MWGLTLLNFTRIIFETKLLHFNSIQTYIYVEAYARFVTNIELMFCLYKHSTLHPWAREEWVGADYLHHCSVYAECSKCIRSAE